MAASNQAAILLVSLCYEDAMKLNSKFFKLLSVVLALIAAVYAAYLLFGSRADTSSTPLQPAAGSRMFMSMEGFRFTQSENGRIAWRMRARKADLYDSKEAQLKDLEITFTPPDNREASLTAEAGLMDTVTGNASIRGLREEVRIVTSEGYLLTTNSLVWKAGQRLVSTADPFKLLGTEIYLEGKGLTANLDMRTIVVNSNVKAVLQE